MVVLVEQRGNEAARGPGREPSLRSCLILVFLPLLAAMISCSEPVHVEDRWTVMGQPFRGEVWMASEADAHAAFAEMREHIDVVESTMRFGVDGSLLANLNARAADEYVQIEDRDFYKVLTLALDYAQFSHGAYDPSIAPLERLYARASRRVLTPGEIEIGMASVGWDKVTRVPEGRAIKFRHPGVELNLDRVAQGFAIDAAARVFARSGSRGGLLRLGPIAAAWQSPPHEDAWSVLIDDPRAPERALLHVRVSNRSLAVAGREPTDVAGVIDPRTGLPSSSDLLAVVAIADSAADASALSAALYVLGSNASGDLLGKMHRAEAILLVDTGEQPSLLASASLHGQIELSPELLAELPGGVRYILPPQKIQVELP